MKRQAAEGILVTSIGSILVKVLGLAATFYVLGTLVPYDFGLWRLLLSVLTFFGLLGIGSLSGVIVADIARELGAGRHTNAEYIVRRTFQIFAITSFAAAGLLCITAPVISKVSGINLTLFLYLLSITILVGAIRQTLNIVFQAYMQPVRAQVLDIVSSISYLISLYIFIGVLDYGLLGIVLSFVVSTLVPVIISGSQLLFLVHPSKLYPREGRYSLKDALWKRGKWAFAEDYTITALNALWPWVAGYFLSIEEVGVISIAVVLFGQVGALVPVQYVLRSVLPRINSDAERMTEWLVRATRFAFVMQILAGIFIYFAFQIVFPQFFPSYTAALPLFALLLLSIPFRAASAVLTEWYYARKAQKAFFFVNVLPKTLMLTLPILLIELGQTGFALWFIIDTVAIYVLSMWYVNRHELFKKKLFTFFIPDAGDLTLAKRAFGEAIKFVKRTS